MARRTTLSSRERRPRRRQPATCTASSVFHRCMAPTCPHTSATTSPPRCASRQLHATDLAGATGDRGASRCTQGGPALDAHAQGGHAPRRRGHPRRPAARHTRLPPRATPASATPRRVPRGFPCAEPGRQPARHPQGEGLIPQKLEHSKPRAQTRHQRLFVAQKINKPISLPAGTPHASRRRGCTWRGIWFGMWFGMWWQGVGDVALHATGGDLRQLTTTSMRPSSTSFLTTSSPA